MAGTTFRSSTLVRICTASTSHQPPYEVYWRGVRRRSFRCWLETFDRIDRRSDSDIIAIQVFQHGTEGDVGQYFTKVAAVLRDEGFFFLRVNSCSTEIFHRHTLIERNEHGGFTIRYEDGPKRGLPVHFYARDELLAKGARDFELVSGPREDVTKRAPPKTGSWAQWEVVWRRRRRV